ncbi:MAG: hypothetical protein JWO98_3217 [Frankiales bacterium]|nr:hypothetical protein [Frankiales bacterium]
MVPRRTTRRLPHSIRVGRPGSGPRAPLPQLAPRTTRRRRPHRSQQQVVVPAQAAGPASSGAWIHRAGRGRASGAPHRALRRPARGGRRRSAPAASGSPTSGAPVSGRRPPVGRPSSIRSAATIHARSRRARSPAVSPPPLDIALPRHGAHSAARQQGRTSAVDDRQSASMSRWSGAPGALTVE